VTQLHELIKREARLLLIAKITRAYNVRATSATAANRDFMIQSPNVEMLRAVAVKASRILL